MYIDGRSSASHKGVLGPSWRGELRLHYTRSGGRTVGHSTYEGPLRVLQPLYPEGPRICHNVIVHPPGGVVAGDELQVNVQVDDGAHALVTTPGATRFYRSDGAIAQQEAWLRLNAGARLEWFPLEAIAYAGCRADNRVRIELAPGAEMMGWDVLALGLPAAGKPFVNGSYRQHLEVPGVWLERGNVSAGDPSLLTSSNGWGGHNVLATMWFVAGAAMTPARREALLGVARTTVAAHPLARTAGVTSPQAAVLVLRALASRVEVVMSLLAQVRAAWRHAAWELTAQPPRIWQT